MRHFHGILLILLSTTASSYETKWMARVVEKHACLEALGSVVSHPQTCRSWTRRETAEPYVDVAAGHIFIGGSDGYLHVVEPRKGSTLKRVELSGNLVSAPQQFEDDLIFATDRGWVYRLSKKDLAVVWQTKLDSGVLQTPYIAKGNAFVVTQLGTLFSVGLADGVIGWTSKRELPNRIFLKHLSTPVLITSNFKGSAREVLAIGNATGTLEFFDAQKGEKLEEMTIGSRDLFGDVAASPVLANGVLYVASNNNGLLAIDAATRVTKWEVKEKGLTEIAVADGIVVAAGPKFVLAVSAISGRKLWDYKFERGAPTAIHIKDGDVFVGSDTDALYVLDLVDGDEKQVLGSGLGFASKVHDFEDDVLAMSSAGALFFFNSTDMVVSGRQVALKGK